MQPTLDDAFAAIGLDLPPVMRRSLPRRQRVRLPMLPSEPLFFADSPTLPVGRTTEEQHSLIATNLGLVKWASKKWKAQFSVLTREEREDACTMALVRAAKKWDSARSANFCTYAARSMLNRMRSAAARKQRRLDRFANDFGDWREPIDYRRDPRLDVEAAEMIQVIEAEFGRRIGTVEVRFKKWRRRS